MEVYQISIIYQFNSIKGDSGLAVCISGSLSLYMTKYTNVQ